MKVDILHIEKEERMIENHGKRRLFAFMWCGLKKWIEDDTGFMYCDAGSEILDLPYYRACTRCEGRLESRPRFFQREEEGIK